jgi:L-lactate dehydrogenase complex protein LldG
MIDPNPNLDQTSVLDDVRRALGRSVTGPSVPPSPLGPFIEPIFEADAGERIARFTAEATAVCAQVHVVSDKQKFAGQIVEQIAGICAAYKRQEIALSGAEIFAELDLASAIAARGFTTFVPSETDHEQFVARLANCGAGVTAADYAIAETGTIVLSSDEPNALLVSLLPPVHIALLRSSQIAASLDEIISKVGQERIGRPDPSRSVTLITGPSRTGDVELVLSIGVHGPKELHVIILD